MSASEWCECNMGDQPRRPNEKDAVRCIDWLDALASAWEALHVLIRHEATDSDPDFKNNLRQTQALIDRTYMKAKKRV